MTSPAAGADRRADRLLAGLATAAFLVLWLPVFNRAYGWFIDELYYLACARHLAFGYVDHPPLSILVLRLVRAVGGESLPVIRLVPAAASGATVWLTGLIARRLGAGAFGQGLAALAVLAGAIFQVMTSLYSMNSLALLLWALAFLLLVEIERRDAPRLWLVLGAVGGLGLENKHTFALLGLGLLVGLLVTPARRHLHTRWPWLGAGIALLLLLPNLAWQAAHGWPSLEFYRNADLYKNVPTPPWDVLVQQVLFMNPAAALVWGAGLVYLLRARAARPYRHLGWIYVVLLVLLMMARSSRPDRITPAYVVLFAAGGTAIDAWVRRGRRGWVRVALPAAIVAVAAVFAPLALPVLPPATAAAYGAKLGIVPQIEAGEGKRSQLPQWLADRLGWQELADQVGAVVATLPPDERRRCVVVTTAYGLAGALERLGHDLPPVYAGQNSYHGWGPPPDPVTVAVVVGLDREMLQVVFTDVREAGRTTCPLITPWREGLGIWIVRGPRVPMADVWPRLRFYE